MNARGVTVRFPHCSQRSPDQTDWSSRCTTARSVAAVVLRKIMEINEPDIANSEIIQEVINTIGLGIY